MLLTNYGSNNRVIIIIGMIVVAVAVSIASLFGDKYRHLQLGLIIGYYGANLLWYFFLKWLMDPIMFYILLGISMGLGSLCGCNTKFNTQKQLISGTVFIGSNMLTFSLMRVILQKYYSFNFIELFFIQLFVVLILSYAGHKF